MVNKNFHFIIQNGDSVSDRNANKTLEPKQTLTYRVWQKKTLQFDSLESHCHKLDAYCVSNRLL